MWNARVQHSHWYCTRHCGTGTRVSRARTYTPYQCEIVWLSVRARQCVCVWESNRVSDRDSPRAVTEQRQFTMKIAVLRDKLDTVRGLRRAQFY